MDAVLVGVITALATLIGVALPLVITATQSSERDKRDRQERMELEQQRLLQERRKECAALLRMARDFGVAVESSYESRGAERAALIRQMRQRAADISGQADEIGLLIPGLGATADALADATSFLVGTVADEKSFALGAPTQRPDAAELEQRVKEFKAAAHAVLYEGSAARETSLVHGELQGDLAVRR
jgi:hypothetical protein